MNFWLLKSEPSVFSIEDMKEKGVEPWNGVRNYQARNFMQMMICGDSCFFYHSNCKDAGIVGIVTVVREAYPDPDDHRFVCVDVRYEQHLPLLSLAFLKTLPELSHLVLFHQSRLSVQPLQQQDFKFICDLAHQVCS